MPCLHILKKNVSCYILGTYQLNRSEAVPNYSQLQNNFMLIFQTDTDYLIDASRYAYSQPMFQLATNAKFQHNISKIMLARPKNIGTCSVNTSSKI